MDSGITPITSQQETELAKKAGGEIYPLRVLIAFDQLINVIFGGHPDETISARAGRAAAAGKLWGKVMSHFLDWFQPDHGAKAEVGDLVRAERVEFLEGNSGTLPPK